ncbi:MULTISPECIES: acyl carrier protein [unclassified Paenibacillus]|uniref:acyl carrier protein n=1 Tax=unclassified Paenibacillus TaxID=185978 RepID=UPI0009A8EE08|nr:MULTISPECIES: acyl carrier protein [unclassified Paenibacillus]SLK20871.1 Phosphopantetheine attachment site [Paenibacillus sp. RU5A]SOC76344.1 Phosphopantetheine attachment site [Paenibacillus sp. RU26A]SOC77947.1 Phosphopantetheine attachment site [Paenibacillus sp. RU5M]
MNIKIIEIIAEIKEDPSLLHTLKGSSDLSQDAGMDSLQIINFILRIEEEFDIEVDFDQFDLEHLQSIDRFSQFIGQMASA